MKFVTQISHHFPLLGIVVAYLLLGVAYSLIVPLGEAPDEVDHFLYVEYLARERQLPVMSPIEAENFTMEANQPPLYYLLNTAVAVWFELTPSADLPFNACYTFDPTDPGRATLYRHTIVEQFPGQGAFLPFQLARFLSLLMGAATIGLAYYMGRQLVPLHPPVAWLAAALLAFNPQFIFITASVNNDVLMALLGAAVVAYAIHTATKATTLTAVYRHAVGLGLLLGAAFLTKYALFAFWPVAVLAVVGATWQCLERDNLTPREIVGLLLPKTAVSIAILLLVPLLLAGWWYGRAWLLYGDPLIWEVHLAAKGVHVLRQSPLTLADLGEFVIVHFQSYWLWLGWLRIKGPVWVYGLLAFMVGAALVGLGLLARRCYQRRCPVNGVALFILLLATTAVYAALIRYIFTINWSGYQGRLAFGAAAPIAVLLAVGLWSLPGRRWVASITAVSLFSLALLTIPMLLLPAYPRPLIYQPAPTPDEQPACVRLAAGLDIEGVRLEPQVGPGETLAITLLTVGLIDRPVPQPLTVRVVGVAGEVLATTSHAISWQAYQFQPITLTLPIAETAVPTRGLIEIATADEPFVPLTIVKIAPHPTPPPDPAYSLDAFFGEAVALRGFDWLVVAEEETAVLTLHWQAIAEITADYTIFVHLLNEQGDLIAQYDSQPRQGTYPTTIWDAGEFVSDTISIAYDPTTFNGDTPQLLIGLYHAETMVRLPLQTETTYQAVDNRLWLPIEQVSR